MTHRDGGGSSWNRQPRPKKQVEERKWRLRIASKKENGFGKAQLEEALRRIREYEGLREIRVLTNSNLIAPKKL